MVFETARREKSSFFGGKAGKNGKLREKEKSYVYAYMAF